jgi:AcrR family transcriptional regulator
MTKVSADEWVEYCMRLLAEGKYLAELRLDELTAGREVTKGAFYTHFANLEELHEAVIGQWAEDRRRATARDLRQIRVIAEPVQRLWFLRTAAKASADADQSMRTWSGTADAFRPARGAVHAAAALRQAREPILAVTIAALSDLGLTAGEASLMGKVLLREFGVGPGDPSVPLADDEAFAALLSIVTRTVPTVRDDQLATVRVEVEDAVPGSGPMAVVVVQSPDARPFDPQELAEQARELFRRVRRLRGGTRAAGPDAGADPG